MLKKRLIPVLLLRDGRCIKTIKFKDFRDTGDPIFASRVYNSQSADELIFLDISASKEKRGILIDVISKVTDECFMPITVGGGIKTVDDINELLKAGTDKVSINTNAVLNPNLITKGAQKFGSQCIIVCIDYKKGKDGKNKVFIEGGSKETDLEPVSWAKEAQRLGAGEILLQSIERDGTMTGYDIVLLKKVSDSLTIPVIALGGAGKLIDFYDGITNGGASAVSAASIFHFTDQSPIKAKVFMKDRGLNVRKI